MFVVLKKCKDQNLLIQFYWDILNGSPSFPTYFNLCKYKEMKNFRNVSSHSRHFSLIKKSKRTTSKFVKIG